MIQFPSAACLDFSRCWKVNSSTFKLITSYSNIKRIFNSAQIGFSYKVAPLCCCFHSPAREFHQQRKLLTTTETGWGPRAFLAKYFINPKRCNTGYFLPVAFNLAGGFKLTMVILWLCQSNKRVIRNLLLTTILIKDRFIRHWLQ